jgi:hypothetical protein
MRTTNKKWLYASTIVYSPAAFFTKVTLLLLLARIYATSTWVPRAIYGFIVFLVIAYIPIQVVKTVICNPIAAFWDPTIQGATCLDQNKIFIADICIAASTDLVILVAPLPMAWTLSPSWWKRMRIAVLLGIGGVAAGLTIWRLYKVVTYGQSVDLTADFVVLHISR